MRSGAVPFQQRKDIVANFSALWKRMDAIFSFFWQEKEFLAANEINIDEKVVIPPETIIEQKGARIYEPFRHTRPDFEQCL